MEKATRISFSLFSGLLGWFIMFWEEPDIVDAIIHWLMK